MRLHVYSHEWITISCRQYYRWLVITATVQFVSESIRSTESTMIFPWSTIPDTNRNCRRDSWWPVTKRCVIFKCFIYDFLIGIFELMQLIKNARERSPRGCCISISSRAVCDWRCVRNKNFDFNFFFWLFFLTVILIDFITSSAISITFDWKCF